MENAAKTSKAANRSHKLSLKEKLGYGFGDLGNGFMFDLGQLYLLKFYTDVLGISGAYAGLVFLVSKLSDAFVDSFVGAYVDSRVFGRRGKFRPFILFGTVPLAIVTVITFLSPNFQTAGKVVWAFVTYVIWNAMYSVVNIPYGSMASVMSQDPVERTQLSSFRMAGSYLAQLITGMAVIPLIMMFSSPHVGYPVVIGIASVFGVIFHICCYKMCKENFVVQKKEEDKLPLATMYKGLLKNRPLIAIILVFILSITCTYIKMGVQIFFLQYNLHNVKLISSLTLVVVGFQLVAVFIAPYLTKLVGKKYVYVIGLSVAVIGDLLNFMTPTTTNTFILFYVVTQFGNAVASGISWAMISDCIEYGEWKTGARTEGVVYSTASFSRKVAQALAGFIPGVVLTAIGYVPNAVQSAATLAGIRQLMFLYPALMSVLAILVLIFVHNLSDKRYKEILAELDARKATV
jgi:GPH family glycoside/pentoside/hexuronide:cation symporter